MANRTYLIQSASNVPATYDPDKDILVGGSYCIPVFWYALFDIGSVVGKPVELDDETSIDYPFLVTGIEEAKTRFAKRSRVLGELFEQKAPEIIQAFDRLLASVDLQFVHLETLEVWMMDDPEIFQTQLTACLRAFELLDGGASSAELLASKEWKELLGQADAEVSGANTPIEPHKLAGYSWVRPVTWKE